MALEKNKTKISLSLQNKLKKYGLITTGLLMSGGDGKLNAAVIYNDIADVTISIANTGAIDHDRYRINFDGMGTADIDMVVGSYVGLKNCVCMAINSSYPDPTDNCKYYSPPCTQQFPTAGLLPAGTIFTAATPISLNSILNQPVSGSDYYSGASFKVGSDTFYGWVRFRVTSFTNPRTMVIYDYAYESTANLGIEIGETSTSILPVELVNFEARAEGEVVKLNWKTATELNNEGFNLQRSTNGRDWENLVFIDGKGTTQAAQEYFYQDDKPYNGLSYYRLEQRDYDGQVDHSPIEAVTIEKESLNLDLFPNPVANDEISIRFDMNSATQVDIEIFNSIGKQVSSFQTATEKGNNNINIPLADLKPGIYFVRLNKNGEVYTKKFVRL